MTEALIPVGENHVPVSQVATLDLINFVHFQERLIASEGQHMGNYDLVRAVAAAKLVLEDREEVSAVQRAASLAGCGDPREVSRRLRELAATHHLVSPVRSVEYIPEGFGVEFSFMTFTPNDYFEVDDSADYCLRSGPLKLIASAANLQWDHAACGRKDNGQNPHVICYAVAARAENFDGTPRQLTGSAIVDWSDGSRAYERLRIQCATKSMFEDALRKARANLHEKAETAAKLRAICDLGVKRRYEASEMLRPFAVAKLTLTGETPDLALKKEISRMRIQAKIGAETALFGAPPVARKTPVPPPKPVVTVEPEPDYDEFDNQFDGYDQPLGECA